MTVRFFTAACLLMLAAACAPPVRVDPVTPLRLPDSVRVQVRDGGRPVVRRVPLEEYVHGAVLSEFAPASGELAAVGRMYEVQAVISRTYALAHVGRHAADGFDLCATTHCQLYEPDRIRTSRWTTAAGQAVAATAGRVLWFDQGPANALFHSDCGGRTSDASHVWGGPAPTYLRGVIDDGAAAAAHTSWTFEINQDRARDALNRQPGTAIGRRLTGIEVVARDAAGRIQRIRLAGERAVEVRGEEFRSAMTQAFGARSVRSTRFDIRRREDVFILEGRGFGHGVGLCQTGAYARARAGTDVAAILETYYPGTRLMRSLRRPPR